jgi:glycogen synthase
MKILMSADAVGGVWTYALELAGALAQHQVQVILAVLGPPPSASQVEAAAQLGNVQLRSAPFKLEWMQQPWSDVAKAGAWLQALAQHEAVQLVHLNNYAHAALPWSVPVVTVAHSCVFTWWQAVHGCRPPESWNEYHRKVSAGLQRTDVLVAPTHSFLQALLECYDTQVRSRVIHNGRTAAAFSIRHEQEREPMLLACGRLWDQAKGMELLQAAATDLAWPCYVAGDLRSPEGMVCRARELVCLGALPPAQLREWLQRAAIFVHPARYEPFGLAVLEAALSGCTLVLGDIPALRELWEGAAEFVDVHDSRSLHQVLRSLIDDPARRQVLQQASRARAARYSATSMAREYHRLYQDLLVGSGQGRAA